MLDNTNLNPHPDYPALPEQAAGIKPDGGCVGCGLAQAAGHLTCSTFKLRNVPVVPDSARFDLERFAQMQGQLHRRAFDSDGIVGSAGDPWYAYNAAKADNFVWFSGWNVTNIDGATLMLTLIGEGDARKILFSTWREKEQGLGLYWINGFESFTSPQALDMVEFQAPSAAARLKGKILRVTAMTATTATVLMDKSYAGIGSDFILGEEEEAPEYPAVKLYHYGRESEAWTYIVPPHFFLGRKKTKTIELVDVPENGIWNLESAVICPPQATETLTPVFVLEGWNVDSWVLIHDDLTRLHIKADSSDYALKTTLPSGSIRPALVSYLTAIYTRFRATYFVETTESDTSCQIVGFDRCFNSRTDASESVGDFGLTKGAGITATGRHVYCGQFTYPEYEYLDEINRSTNPPSAGTDGIFDRVETTLHNPAGLAEFPMQTGKCIQYGYCNKFVNSMDMQGDREAPFSMDYMRFLRELWFACDKRLVQKYIGSFGAGGFNTERVAHPSIMWLNDYYAGLVSPDGYNVHHTPRGNGTWFPKKPFTYIDANGDEHLRNAGGLERGYRFEYDDVTETDIVDSNQRGNLPDSVADYTTMRDPFDRAETVTTDLLEYIGCRVERDTLQIVESRGLGNISLALGEEDIIAPNFDVAVTDLQRCDRATFIKPADGDAVITILPYRQDEKAEVTIGSRTGAKQTSLGGHRWLLDFANESHAFSRKNLGSSEPGDSYNEIFSVMAGGGPCILPFEHQSLNSFDGEKATGSRAAGAMPLDCIEMPDGSRFVIEYVTPHGGDKAAGYGNRKLINKGIVGGYYEMPVASGADGVPLTPVSITSVTRVSDSAVIAVLEDAEKPELEIDQAWFDGNQRLYFSSVDDADGFDIVYADSAAAPYTNGFTVQQNFTVATETDYTEWSGADTTAIYLGGVAAVVTVGGAVDPSHNAVRVNDVSGKIHLTFNIDDAPGDWKLVLVFDVAADAPQDDWAAGGKYTTFARKQDVAVVRADALTGGGDWFTENTIDTESVTFIQSGTTFLPALTAAQVVEWTVQGTDAWAAVPAGFVTVNAASGVVTVLAGFFTANFPEGTGRVCFKLPDIQMVDNRGQVPASLLNKTEAVLDAMRWRLTGMGSGRGAVYVAKGLTRSMGFGRVEVDPPDLCNPEYELKSDVTEEIVPGTTPSGNYYHLRSVGHNSTVQTRFFSSSFGLPIEFENFADGVEIAEAVAEISGSGLTRVHIVGSLGPVTGDGGVEYIPFEDGTYDVDLIDIDYVVIGFTSPTDYEVVGRIPGAANGQKVVSVTSLMQAMFDGRRNYPYGFGLLYIPNGGSMTLPPIDVSFVDVPTTETAPYHCPITRIYLARDITTQLRWDTLSFGKISIKIDYNGTDKLCQPGPRLPAMIDLPV